MLFRSSSVSQPFCGACSRARLSSEGKFYTCLFASKGIDLRAPLRGGADDAELLRILRGAWLGRSDRYSELREELHGAADILRGRIAEVQARH